MEIWNQIIMLPYTGKLRELQETKMETKKIASWNQLLEERKWGIIVVSNW